MTFPYNLLHPDDSYTLDQELDEISGITSAKHNCLTCVQDESRDIYELQNGKIVNHFKSGKKGDSEDIVVMDDTAYILDAKKCAIYEYKNYVKSMKNPKKHKLNLNKSFDPEGMCYDKHNECLLVACKGNPIKESIIRKIFIFDLNRHVLKNKAYFTVDSNTLSDNSTGKIFNPSGIAIHPKTSEIYLIGSRSLKMIVCLDTKGDKILSKEKLKDSIFGQPEGITFSVEGDLLISSERKNSTSAEIFRFKYIMRA
jgi:uncharacterized protein YjiK